MQSSSKYHHTAQIFGKWHRLHTNPTSPKYVSEKFLQKYILPLMCQYQPGKVVCCVVYGISLVLITHTPPGLFSLNSSSTDFYTSQWMCQTNHMLLCYLVIHPISFLLELSLSSLSLSQINNYLVSFFMSVKTGILQTEYLS